MKKLFTIILTLALFIPSMVFADTSAQDLRDTLTDADIAISDDSYEETDDQITLYLFWSTTCSHCHDLLEFINENLSEYGSKFKLRSYEVSNNSNSTLQSRVAKFMDITAPGVPLLVVGESTFYGFSDATGEKILEAIDAEYEATEKYDVLEEMENSSSSSKKSNVALYVFISILGIGAIAFLILLAKKE